MTQQRVGGSPPSQQSREPHTGRWSRRKQGGKAGKTREECSGSQCFQEEGAVSAGPLGGQQRWVRKAGGGWVGGARKFLTPNGDLGDLEVENPGEEGRGPQAEALGRWVVWPMGTRGQSGCRRARGGGWGSCDRSGCPAVGRGKGEGSARHLGSGEAPSWEG